MGEQIDFGELYEHLRVTPGCSLEEFQLAYRRRVAVLHPDRASGNADELQRLNTLYAAAMEFRTQSGRLPGARGTPQARYQETWSRNPAPATAQARDRPRHPWLLAGLIGTLLVWAFSNRVSTPQQPVNDLAGPEHDPASGIVMADELALGMKPAVVLAIEGEPVYTTHAQWHYGPSWIEFRCGVVDDWYSSPLRPLHVRSARPLTDAGRAAYDCEDHPGWKGQSKAPRL